jgi:hypothetical protein
MIDMEIYIEKTVMAQETVNPIYLKVVTLDERDLDSTNIEVHYRGQEIGYGHLNNKTNFAHITLYQENQELEDYLVRAIENRTIDIQ